MVHPVTSQCDDRAADDPGSVLLKGIARVRERFLDATRVLERRPEVRAARSGADCREYRGGTTLEFYVEADVAGRTVCWWLEASRRDVAWEIAASVLENRRDREGQDELEAVAVRRAMGGVPLAAELEIAAATLLATIERAEFFASAV